MLIYLLLAKIGNKRLLKSTFFSNIKNTYI